MMDNLDLTNSNLLGEEFSYARGKKIKDKVKDKVKKTKDKLKKKITKLKDKVGKGGKNFRNRFRGVLRKGILKNISRNVHGMATRLYPAVAPADAVSKARYKKDFTAKSKKVYSELLARWKKIGGEEKDLNDAIMKGSKKGIFKVKGRKGGNSSATQIQKTGAVQKRGGGQALGLSETTSQIQKTGAVQKRGGGQALGLSEMGIDGYSNLTDESLLSGLTNMSLLNASGEDNSDYFYGVISPDDETSEEEGTATDDDETEEVPEKEEVQKAHKGFFAWLKGLFKKNKAEETPFEADAPDADTFVADTKEDNKNLPADEEATNDTVTELDKTDTADDAGGATDGSKGYEKTNGDDYTGENNDKILGLPKTAFWISVGALALVGGFFLYRKMSGKK